MGCSVSSSICKNFWMTSASFSSSTEIYSVVPLFPGLLLWWFRRYSSAVSHYHLITFSPRVVKSALHTWWTLPAKKSIANITSSTASEKIENGILHILFFKRMGRTRASVIGWWVFSASFMSIFTATKFSFVVSLFANKLLANLRMPPVSMVPSNISSSKVTVAIMQWFLWFNVIAG